MYNRDKAIAYAKKWAYKRNPKYFDYNCIGGDCTNFASQVLFAGGEEMNYKPVFGWYYKNPNDKAPAWTGVNELYNFLTTNRGAGPRAIETDINGIMPGDLVQLDFNGDGKYDHTPVIIDTGKNTLDTVLVAAHTVDSYARPLSTYNFKNARYLHII